MAYLSPSVQIFKNITPTPSCSSDLKATLEERQTTWTTLYRQTLPSLARAKSQNQAVWPVHLDHCFARIILDAVVGVSEGNNSDTQPRPWAEKIPKPAVKHMSEKQLNQCIELGAAIAKGTVDLVELDQASLAVRGKSKIKEQKRKRDDTVIAPSPSSKKQRIENSKAQQPDIRTAMGLPPPPPKSPSAGHSQPPPATVDKSITSKIQLHPALTPFRRRVLLALCQVPAGQFTTYLAISNFLHSSPRAVGNGLRNNPFAPQVPCHRVVAADGGIGGFGGEWGVKGARNGEKVGLLRGEGVEVEAGDGKVVGKAWTGFE